MGFENIKKQLFPEVDMQEVELIEASSVECPGCGYWGKQVGARQVGTVSVVFVCPQCKMKQVIKWKIDL